MAEMHLQHDLRQTLELMLSPHLLQMLKVLNLSYIDLVEHINKEAEENPVLEVEHHDEYVEIIKYLTSDRKIKKEVDFSELPGLENISNVCNTLEKHLLEQLKLEDLEDTQYQIARHIIGNIDDLGYTLAYPRLREKMMADYDVSRPTVDKVLSIIQSFEPEGVGARDLKECLLIQIREYNFENASLKEILTKAVEKHLADLSKKDYQKVARALDISDTGAEEIANYIKNNLNPNPGSSFGGESRHVIPSFAVEKTDQGYSVVNLETRYGPKINISQRYLKILEDPKTDAETKAYLREKLKNAKNLIEAFSRRSEIIDKSVRKIIARQADFLNQGIIFLRPLTQKSLADEFGVHPSTISRTVAEKYVQTPQGMFPLKFLCPRGPKGQTVGRTKAMLVGIVDQEDKQAPLSDSQLTAKMKEQGARIDRRTVAYYRKELKIPTAEGRKNHD
ncbi:MAG: RNA polymerase factor sigma-54 [bacterium]